MNYDEFIDRVQERAGMADRDQAVRVTQATLETFGERIYRTHREHLAAQLPNELKPSVLKRGKRQVTRQDVDRFPLEDFYHRVGARADIGYSHAVRQAQAVVGVLSEALAGGEWEDIRSEFPDEYDPLFGR